MLALLIAFPISNAGIVVKANTIHITNSLNWNVPGSIPNTLFNPGTYIADKVIMLVITTTPNNHQLKFLKLE